MSKNDRMYNIPDAILIQHAEKIAETIPGDLSAFSTFDSTITQTYPQKIRKAVDDVLAIKSDDIVIDEMAEYTQRMQDALGKCNMAYKTIAYFVRKVYSDNIAVQNQFGLNDIQKARKRQAEMILFMESLDKVAKSYKNELVKAGCNSSVIDDFGKILNELRDANTNQEKFKNERGLITQERVENLNRLYELVLPISQVAYIVYADNPAMLEKYAIPRPSTSTESMDDLL